MDAWDFTRVGRMDCRILSRARLFSRLRPGRTLLFTHGGFHGAWCWAGFLDFFSARGVSVAALDLRGHGGVTQGEDFAAQGLEAMAEDVTEAVAAVASDVILVGHSLGVIAAARASQCFGPLGFAMLAPALAGGLPGARLLPAFPPDRTIAPPGAERARKWFLSGYTGEDISPFLARLCPESPLFLNECLHGSALEPARVKGPVLCLSGAKDESPLHPKGQDEAVAAQHGAALVTIPAAGHCMMLDDAWETTADILYEWLRSHRLAGESLT